MNNDTFTTDDNKTYILNATEPTIETFKTPYKAFLKAQSGIEVRADTLPPVVNLRSQWGPCYDQGPLGSCVPNSVIGNIRLVTKKLTGISFLGSRMFNYYTFRSIWGDVNDSQQGCSVDGCIKAIQYMGLCEEKYWPYDISKVKDKPSDAAYNIAHLHTCVSLNLGNNLDNIKHCLNDGFPVIFCLVLTDTWGVTNGIINKPGKPGGAHAMNFVGYDDIKQCFIVANSWGGWGGDQGFFYLPYEYGLTGWGYTSIRFLGKAVEPIPKNPNTVSLYDLANFQSSEAELPIGKYPTLASMKNINADSIRLFKGLTAKLYFEENFKGTPIILNRSSRWLIRDSNKIRSMEVYITPPPYMLKTDELLYTNEFLQSENSIYKLVVNNNGTFNIIEKNKVIYTFGKASPIGTYFLTCQSDGNLVIYNSANAPVWATNTYFKKLEYNTSFVLKDSGMAKLYDPTNTIIWATPAPPEPPKPEPPKPEPPKPEPPKPEPPKPEPPKPEPPKPEPPKPEPPKPEPPKPEPPKPEPPKPEPISQVNYKDESDFVLGLTCASRGDTGRSRALVKNTNNRLTINYGGDFNGGVSIDSDLSIKDKLIVSNRDILEEIDEIRYILANIRKCL